jgi:hypothetical protein
MPPGAESRCGVLMVWMESTIIIAGMQFLGLLEDFGGVRLRQDVALRLKIAHAVGAHFDLFFALFAADVQHFGRGFSWQFAAAGAFSDARLPADEHQRTRHDASAQHPVEFLVGRGKARRGARLTCCEQHGFGGVRFARVPTTCVSPQQPIGCPFAQIWGRFSSATVSFWISSSW